MSSNLSNSSLFVRTNKYQQIKRDRHQENEYLVEYLISLQWQNGNAMYKAQYKVAKEFHKILAHKIHQAPTEFFLKH